MIRIGMDVDGVLADFNSAFTALIRQQTGIDIAHGPEGPSSWHWPGEAGVTKAQENKLWETIKLSHTFWVSLKPLPGAYEVLRMLDALQGYYHAQTYFITARPGDWAHEQTKRWLRTWGMVDPQVLIARKPEEKAKVAEGLGLDCVVDDRLENANTYATRVPKANVFLIDRPYNQGTLFNPGKRVAHPMDALRAMGLTHPAYGIVRVDGFDNVTEAHAGVLVGSDEEQ